MELAKPVIFSIFIIIIGGPIGIIFVVIMWALIAVCMTMDKMDK